MKGRMTLNKSEKVKALVEAIVDQPYGTLFEHYKISSIIGVPYGTQSYGEIISRAKKELLNSGKMIVSVWKVGYRIADPDEYVDQSAKKVVRGAHQVDIGVRILDYAPVKDMTSDGIQKYNVYADRMRIMQASVHGAKVELKMLAKKRENPLRSAIIGS